MLKRILHKYIVWPVILLIGVNIFVIFIGYFNFRTNAKMLANSVENQLDLISMELNKDIEEIEDYIYLNIQEDRDYNILCYSEEKTFQNTEFYLSAMNIMNKMDTLVAVDDELKSIFLKIDGCDIMLKRGDGDIPVQLYADNMHVDGQISAEIDNKENPSMLTYIQYTKTGAIGFVLDLDTYIDQIYSEAVSPQKLCVDTVDTLENYVQKDQMILTKTIKNTDLMIVCTYERSIMGSSMSKSAYVILIIAAGTLLITPVLIRHYYKMKMELYESEAKEKELQLTYLSRRIRPHFILNVLNMIYSFKASEWPVAQKTILNLIEYFRYIVDAKNDYVTLKREMNFLKKYFEIQKQRLDGKFIYMISWEQSLDEVLIPPLVISTFVENSIKHGLLDGTSNCIVVTVNRVDDYMEIKISDSGEGFSENILNEINQFKEHNIEGENLGVGILNVIQRLDLYYKKQYQIKFWNENGAVVEMRLPIDIKTKGEK